MLDTIFSTNTPFLMTRFVSPGLDRYAIAYDGDKFLYRDLIKATYNDFCYHCLSQKPDGKIFAILHAEINIRGKYELHQYVIWGLHGQAIATFLQGNEDFKIERLRK